MLLKNVLCKFQDLQAQYKISKGVHKDINPPLSCILEAALCL